MHPFIGADGFCQKPPMPSKTYMLYAAKKRKILVASFPYISAVTIDGICEMMWEAEPPYIRDTYKALRKERSKVRQRPKPMDSPMDAEKQALLEIRELTGAHEWRRL
jgi:hypothetical protein